MFSPKRLVLPLILGLLSVFLHAETVKDREGAVRKDRETMEKDARWIYNDWQHGFAEAKRSGKPLLVVLRCVPCLACAGIDAQVLLQETELAPLLDQFVCVRLINANTLDLRLFQFDYDLSFSTLFFNADGTVYGRYGSWAHQKDAQEKAISGYRRALEAALELHRGYPANKDALAAKQGRPMPFQTPLDMPTLQGKYGPELTWSGKVVQSCVHCHQIGDALRISFRQKRKPIPTEWIYPWPAPETVGLTLSPDHIARVSAVAENSIAARAGLQPGDDFLTVDGQPLISIADVSWALHYAPESGVSTVKVKRGSTERLLELSLPGGWRSKADISRRVGTWPMRGMATGGLVLEDLSDAARAERAIDAKAMALLVKHVGEYGEHAAAKKAGFRKEDVIVQVADASERVGEGELLGRLLQQYRRGEKVKTTVLRGDARFELLLPMQ